MFKPIGNKAISLNYLRSSGFNIPFFLSFDSKTSFKHVRALVSEKFKENALKIGFSATKWAFVVPKRHNKIRESQPSPPEGRLMAQMGPKLAQGSQLEAI